MARILRPRGNKGEVIAELLTDFASRFSNLKQFYLRKSKGDPHPVGLQRFWPDQNHPGMGVFHFAGYASISEAEALRGWEVLLPLEQRVDLPVGQYFVTDLIGCTVFQAGEEAKLSSPACAMGETPRLLGTVRDVYFPGENVRGTPLLQVETAAGELLLPFAEDICRTIDVPARRIDVRLPEGLTELNTPE
jgi:16S rRNA processing protein RimM